MQYHLLCDPEATGNFECTIFETAELTGEGTPLWYKSQQGALPFQDETAMVQIADMLSGKQVSVPQTSA